MKLQKENDVSFEFKTGDLYGRYKIIEPEVWKWKYAIIENSCLILYDLENRETDSYGSRFITLNNRIIVRDSTIHYCDGTEEFFDAVKKLAKNSSCT